MSPTSWWKYYWSSLSNLKFYRELLSSSIGRSFRFWLMSMLLINGLITIAFVIIDIPRLETEAVRIYQQLRQNLPTGWQFNWNGKELSTNLTQAITIPIPKEWQSPEFNVSKLLIYDPSASSSAELKSAAAVMVANNRQLSIQRVDQATPDWQDLELSDVLGQENFSFNDQSWQQLEIFVERWQRYGRGLLGIGHYLLLTIIGTPIKLIVMIVEMGLFNLVWRFFGKPLSWRKLIQLGLHLMVIAQTAVGITAVTNTRLPIYALVFWGYLLAIVFTQFRQNETTSNK